jgi:hypothetical protein
MLEAKEKMLGKKFDVPMQLFSIEIIVRCFVNIQKVAVAQ